MNVNDILKLIMISDRQYSGYGSIIACDLSVVVSVDLSALSSRHFVAFCSILWVQFTIIPQRGFRGLKNYLNLY